MFAILILLCWEPPHAGHWGCEMDHNYKSHSRDYVVIGYATTLEECAIRGRAHEARLKKRPGWSKWVVGSTCGPVEM